MNHKEQQLAKALRINRLESEMLRLSALMMIPVDGLLLDVSKLPAQPPGLRLALIKWIMHANEERIAKGEKALITMGLIMACPIWKIVPIPFTKAELTSRGLLNPLKPERVIGRHQATGSINKKSSTKR